MGNNACPMDFYTILSGVLLVINLTLNKQHIANSNILLSYFRELSKTGYIMPSHFFALLASFTYILLRGNHTNVGNAIT
jgi:hypothetical protein